MAFRIFIDPGHGGADPGAVYNGRQEKDDNLNLALAVGRILEDYGLDVVYSRTEDFYDTPYEKAMKGNESEADLFLSIHRNAAVPPGSGNGVDALVYADTGFSSEVASEIGEAIEDIGWQFNGITERPNLAVLRRTKMPAVLLEAGFIDNEMDNQFFDENFDALAEAIALGVLNSLEDEADYDTMQETGCSDCPHNSAMNADLTSAFTDINTDPASYYVSDGWQDTSSVAAVTRPSGPGSAMPPQGTQPGNPMMPGNQQPGTSGAPSARPPMAPGNQQPGTSGAPSARPPMAPGNQQPGISGAPSARPPMAPGNQQPGTSGAPSARPPMAPGNQQPWPPFYPAQPCPKPPIPGLYPTENGDPQNMNQGLYRVQVGAFTNPMFATQLLNQLLLEGFPAFIVFSDGLYRVQVGAFCLLDNAVRMEQRLRAQGYQTFITT